MSDWIDRMQLNSMHGYDDSTSETVVQPCPMCPPHLREVSRTESPFRHASMACVTALFRLGFERDEVVSLLHIFSEESETSGLRIGALYRRLAVVGIQCGAAGVTMYKNLGARFGETKNNGVGLCPMLKVAERWAEARDTQDGRRAVALLLSVAVASAPCFRRLETIMLEDLTYMTSRSLMTQSGGRPIHAT